MGSGLSFRFATVAGAEYIVEFTEQLESPQWTELQRLPGTGGSAQLTDPVLLVPRRFYRVKVR